VCNKLCILILCNAVLCVRWLINVGFYEAFFLMNLLSCGSQWKENTQKCGYVANYYFLISCLQFVISLFFLCLIVFVHPPLEWKTRGPLGPYRFKKGFRMLCAHKTLAVICAIYLKLVLKCIMHSDVCYVLILWAIFLFAFLYMP
jgi:hypothetical protein